MITDATPMTHLPAVILVRAELHPAGPLELLVVPVTRAAPPAGVHYVGGLNTVRHKPPTPHLTINSPTLSRAQAQLMAPLLIVSTL